MDKDLLTKAEQGDAKSQFVLGVLYENAIVVKQNYTIAFGWYTKAAEQGLAEAQYNLGIMCYNGIGVNQDLNTASQWFELSARQGHKQAKRMLALLIKKHIPPGGKIVK